jgi:hypothetical protein
MEILNITEDKVTQITYTIQLSDPYMSTVVHYKEWVDESGTVIDSQLISKHGYDMSDEHGLVDDIIEMLEKLETK